MAAPKGGSRERLLNAAQQLFAERGYAGTTTREIAARAGDTLGTLSYHFKNKDALLAEVVGRRFDELAELRRAMYAKMVAESGKAGPSVEDVIEAIVVPFLRQGMLAGPAWASYIQLLCRFVYVSDQSHHQEMVGEHIDPFSREVLGWLAAAAPQSSPENRGYAYQFVIGCMVDSIVQSESDRLARISDGACDPFDFEALCKRLISFVTAGTKAVLAMKD